MGIVFEDVGLVGEKNRREREDDEEKEKERGGDRKKKRGTYTLMH